MLLDWFVCYGNCKVILDYLINQLAVPYVGSPLDTCPPRSYQTLLRLLVTWFAPLCSFLLSVFGSKGLCAVFGFVSELLWSVMEPLWFSAGSVVL